VYCAWRCDALLGEGPVWDERASALYFVDLKGGAVHRWQPDGSTRTWQLGGIVSTLALTASPETILCASSAGFERLSLETGARDLVAPPLPMTAGMRSNDGGCDAHGNFWIGTMEDAEQHSLGALYRLVPGQAPELKLDGVGVSNGLGWSPGGTRFYFTDSLRRAIYRFEFDLSTGALGERSLFAEIADGAPDGLAVDGEGYVWSAIWDGWRIVRYAPDGTIDRTVDMPVPRPTSLAFGGHDLTTLYITSARIGLSGAVLEKAPLSGALFAFEAGVSGLPANRTRIGM
jgi:sugar lactone lactonase YvrE